MLLFSNSLSPWRRHRATAMRRSAFPHPEPVALVLNLMVRLLVQVKPTMGFGMTVRECKAAAPVMISAWHIVPPGMLHPKGKGSIVQIIEVFVHQHPKH